MKPRVSSLQWLGCWRKADFCITSDQDIATENSQSRDDEIESNQSYAWLTVDMLADQSFGDVSPYNSALPMNVLAIGPCLKWLKVGRLAQGIRGGITPRRILITWSFWRSFFEGFCTWLVDAEKVDMKFVRVG